MSGNTPEKKDRWILKRGVVIGALLIFGPLALPLLWVSPNFKFPAKAALSAVFIGLSILTYLYMPVFLDRILEQAQATGLAS